MVDINRVYQYALDNNLIDQMGSAAGDIDFKIAVAVANPKVSVEIGTYRGISAAYIAQFGIVHTFDTFDYAGKQKAWEDLGVAGNIHFHLIRTKEDIGQILKDMNFDFAFVDDGHEYEQCKADFELVKCCHRVIIHDVSHPFFTGVSQFADEIGLTRLGNNGYWTDL